MGKWRHPSERLTTASLDGARGLAGLTPSGSTHRDEFARVESPGQVGPMAKEFSVIIERDGEGYMSRPCPGSRAPTRHQRVTGTVRGVEARSLGGPPGVI